MKQGVMPYSEPRDFVRNLGLSVEYKSEGSERILEESCSVGHLADFAYFQCLWQSAVCPSQRVG